MNKPNHRWILGLCISAATAVGCGSTDPSLRFAPSVPGQAATRHSVEATLAVRCKPFASTFDEVVACQRADGTLDSFGDQKIAWRVRYFVRYWAMPCNEEPTEQEAYVFHMVTTDLYDDAALSETERAAIRNVMFDGKTHCK